MAVSTPAPGRHQEFAIEPERQVGYRILRRIFTTLMWLLFRPKVAGKQHLPTSGPVILAPVHRSFADFGFTAFCTRRKLFFMTKDSMWEKKWLGRLLLYVGAFPVHRESADREALRRAQRVLEAGEVLILFPEGTTSDGSRVMPFRSAFLSVAQLPATPDGKPVDTFPFPVTQEAMQRGQQRFDIYCAPCHDRTGRHKKSAS